MLPHDPTGKNGIVSPVPDVVKVLEPKEEAVRAAQPFAQNLEQVPVSAAAPAVDLTSAV